MDIIHEMEVRRPFSVPEYITVLSEHKHHYTGETMRCIRTDTVIGWEERPISSYTFVNEKEWEYLLRYRVS